MFQGRDQTTAAGRHERWGVAADCKGHDPHAGAGWEDGRGFWAYGVVARGNDRGPRSEVEGARAPGVRWRTWRPAGAGD